MRFDYSPHIDLPKAKQINSPSGRRYETPAGSLYPSITTVLGAQPEKRRALAEWRKRVGAEKAQAISTQAARRGTNLHNLMEKYILGDDVDPRTVLPATIAHFKPVRKCVDKKKFILFF